MTHEPNTAETDPLTPAQVQAARERVADLANGVVKPVHGHPLAADLRTLLAALDQAASELILGGEAQPHG